MTGFQRTLTDCLVVSNYAWPYRYFDLFYGKQILSTEHIPVVCSAAYESSVNNTHELPCEKHRWHWFDSQGWTQRFGITAPLRRTELHSISHVWLYKVVRADQRRLTNVKLWQETTVSQGSNTPFTGWNPVPQRAFLAPIWYQHYFKLHLLHRYFPSHPKEKSIWHFNQCLEVFLTPTMVMYGWLCSKHLRLFCVSLSPTPNGHLGAQDA